MAGALLADATASGWGAQSVRPYSGDGVDVRAAAGSDQAEGGEGAERGDWTRGCSAPTRPGLSHAAGQCRMLTARAITSSEVSRAETLWMLIRSFARVDSGIVSVGLNAVELVTET